MTGASNHAGTVQPTNPSSQESGLLNKVTGFLVDAADLFEVGGKGKTFRQIKDTPNSFIAYDDVEMGVGNKIPLWLFGFLY